METTSSSWFVEVDTQKDCPGKRALPPKMNKTFHEALREKYCASVQNIKTQHFEIVFQGRPKTSDADSGELAYLRNVVLNDRKISKCGLLGDDLTLLCPNVIDLDLSGNLFESWEEILPIITQLPNLSFLNLARNKIRNNKGALQRWSQKTSSSSLENLVLNMTQIKWSDVLHLAKLLPSLKELHICTNGYSRLPDVDYSPLSGVECLRLNNNKIESWDEIWKLRHLPNLKSLILSGNPLTDIYFQENSIGLNLPCVSCCLDNKKEKDENGNTNDDEKSDISSHEDTETSGSSDNENGNKGEGHESTLTPDLDPEQEDGAIETWCKQILDDVIGKMQVCMSDKSQKTTEMMTGDVEQKNDQGNNSGCTGSKGENSDVLKGDNCDCHCQKLRRGERRSQKAFQSLHNLCLSETAIGKWKHLNALSCFPSLKSLRIKDVRLASKLTSEDRRKLFVASLPNISLLNGSEVTWTERDKSERHFLRYFQNKRLKPHNFHSLEKKHGKLSPIVDIDIGAGFQEWATLTFIYRGREAFREKIRIVEPVGRLRVRVTQKLHLYASLKNLKLFLKRCGPDHRDPEEERMELDELFLDSLPMSRFDIMDGDEIHIQLQDRFEEEGFLNFLNIKYYFEDNWLM